MLDTTSETNRISKLNPTDMLSYDRLMSREDLARYLNVSMRTVDTIRAIGFSGRPALEPILKTGRMVCWSPEQVKNWLMIPEKRIKHAGGRPRKVDASSPAPSSATA